MSKPLRDPKSLIIGVDFDGTVVEDAFPKVGPPAFACSTVLRLLRDKGHRIILWTVRSDKYLDDAVQYFNDIDVPLYGINENPEQHKFSTSPKAHCNIFIDDKALGIPLIHPEDGRKPYVDWEEVHGLLRKAGAL